MISREGAGLFAIGQYWLIDICGGDLSGRVDLRVDRGYFGNHMTIIQDAPKADDIVGLFRILSGLHRGRPPKSKNKFNAPDIDQCLPPQSTMNLFKPYVIRLSYQVKHGRGWHEYTV